MRTRLPITLAVLTCLLQSPNVQAETARAQPACSAQALTQAKKLLEFHIGEDDRISIEPAAKAVSSISNPADAKQKFEVVEVWGNVYKGRYRMRFIYGGSGDVACTLMGQEILEYAKL